MDRATATALRDALKALKRAEKLLEEHRPAMVQAARAAPALRELEKAASEHASVALDLRMARLRIEVIIPPEEDPDKTPVEPIRRLSEQLAAIRPPRDPDDPDKR